MTRQNPGQPPYEDPNLFSGGEVAADAPQPAKRGFWLKLFLAQPLLMVGGMWIFLALIAAIAFGGLLNPGMKTLPKLNPLERARLSQTQQSTSANDPQRNQASNRGRFGPHRVEDPHGADKQTKAKQESEDLDLGPSVPVWSLATLALICASGCWVIDQFLNAPPSTPIKKLRQPNKPVNSHQSTLKPLKRLKPYPASQSIPLPTSGEMPPPPEQPSPPPEAAPVEPAVVPPSESNSLDWPDGSLAHQLDLRQQKSLSSWL